MRTNRFSPGAFVGALVSSWCLFILSTACDERLAPPAVFLQSFVVTIRGDAGVLGSPESPLQTAATTAASFVVDVEARGSDGRPFDYTGQVFFAGAPGEVTPCTAYVVDGGLYGQAVSIVRTYGRATINVFTGEFSCQTAVSLEMPLKPRAIGASQPINFPNLSIPEVQGTDKSPFARQAVRIDRGTLVVTHVTQDGFYVADTTQSAYASVFAYTYSRPDDLFRGDRLFYIAGGASEFPNNETNGFTEINFPSWSVDRSCDAGACQIGEFCVSGTCKSRACGAFWCYAGEVCDNGTCRALPSIPAVDLLSNEVVASNYGLGNEMEKRESSFVRVERVKVATTFKNCDFDSSGECVYCRYCSTDGECSGTGQGGKCLLTGKCDCDANTLNEDKCEADCENDSTCTSECDYKEYGQWKVTLEQGTGASVLVNSRDTVPDFDPKQNLGAVLKSVQGMLRDVPGKPGWVIEPRDPRDLVK